jgi:hypothetical protein
MSHWTRTLAFFAGLAAVLPGVAVGQSPDFSYHKDLAPGQAVEIRGVNGVIDAQPASGSTLEVTAIKREHHHGDVADVQIQAVEWNGGVTICAVYPNSRRSRRDNQCGHGDDYQMNTNDNDVEVRFTVKVPRGVQLDASTVNGDVRATGLTGDADLHTVNGGIDVTTSGTVEAETVNGDIDARIGRTDWTGGLKFETVNGSVSLTAPGDLSTDISASTVNGSVDSDFPITVRGRMERRSLRGTIGSGGRSLELTTVNGGIAPQKGA